MLLDAELPQIPLGNRVAGSRYPGVSLDHGLQCTGKLHPCSPMFEGKDF